MYPDVLSQPLLELLKKLHSVLQTPNPKPRFLRMEAGIFYDFEGYVRIKALKFFGKLPIIVLSKLVEADRKQRPGGSGL
jgi:hypothetical protein